jgi:NADPH:quinone reductase-like Zn-dependent oxidoreductase
VIHKYGGPEVLKIENVPVHDPGPGDVLVRTQAAAVNPVDVKTRQGVYAGGVPLARPMILGWDLAGVVESVGPHVTEWHLGDRVIAMSVQYLAGVGTHRDHVIVSRSILAPAPHRVQPVEAAAIPLAALTAQQALDRLALNPGETVLISGGGGQVAGFAIQLAKLRGLRVVTTVRPGQEARVGRLGPDTMINASQLPAPHPLADGALITVDGGRDLIGFVHAGGSYVTVRRAEVPAPQRGITVSHLLVEQNGQQLRELVALVDAGLLNPRVAQVLRVDDVARAHDLVARGGLDGKVVLTFDRGPKFAPMLPKL